MGRGTRVVMAVALVFGLGGCEAENQFLGLGSDGRPFAQPGSIEGSVSVSGAPVGAAWVVALELRDSTITDSQGRFQFVEVPAAVHTISLRVPIQYRLVPGDSTTQTVTVTPGGRGIASWRLTPVGPFP
jgi:hypothetical protein